MKTSPRLLAVLLALTALPLAQLLYPGCATLFSGTTQPVRVKSKPTGAQVFLNGKNIGATPVTAVVSRWGFHRVRIELAGYEPYEVRLEKHYNDAATANVYIGGGWIVIDALTGAIFSQDVSEGERLKLMKHKHEIDDPSGELFTPTPLFIDVALKPAPSARKIGQMVPRKA